MLLAVIITFSVLIFPIFLNGKLSLSKENKELKYSVKIFWLFKVLYGYFELDKEGIIIHLNKRKAILIEYNRLLSIRKKFKPLKDYHLLRFNSTLNIGISENELIIDITTFYSIITEILGEYFRFNKPYFKIQNTMNIYEGANMLNLYFSAELVLNLLMVIISAFKIFMEKFIYAIKSRTQQN